MIECTWGHEDCINNDDKCYLCISEDYHYKQPKNKKFGINKKAMKQDKRTGSGFEFKNHEGVRKNLINDISTRLTPNSGAGYVKGDQQISGIVTIMEELKTKIIQKAPGRETFTIQKKWLDKLHREAMQADQEFWYLKFSFLESDKNVYVIVEADMIDSMVKTMVKDRLAISKAEAKQDIAEKMRRKTECDLIAAQAEIDLLKAQLKLCKYE